MPGPDDRAELERLIRVGSPCISVITADEPHVLDRLDGIAREQGLLVWLWSATRGAGPYDALGEGHPNTEDPAAGLLHLRQAVELPAVIITLDLAAQLDNPVAVRALRDLIGRLRRDGGTVVMIDPADTLPDVIRGEAMTVPIAPPDRAELKDLVKQTLQRVHRSRELTATLSRSELDIILRDLQGLHRGQVEQVIRACVADDATFSAEDINTVLAAKRRLLHESTVLEYVETPVDLSSIGGLTHLKAWLADRDAATTDRAAAFGLDAPRGVLLLGVQGAGKSLSAKAIATAWGQPLLRLDPGRLYDRFVGASEQRLRLALSQAERMAPVVVWIDEIEKGFASAATHSTDGGLSQRMFGTLLTWMQDREAPVFLVATANNIDALPPELLRKGRFDEIFFVDLPTPPVRRKIFSIHLRRRNRNPASFDLDRLAETSAGYSGAEIETAILDALHSAFAGDAELTTEAVERSLRKSPPLAVTRAEDVDRLRRWAAERCRPAG